MKLTLRKNLNRPLTNNEIDENFEYLDQNGGGSSSSKTQRIIGGEWGTLMDPESESGYLELPNKDGSYEDILVSMKNGISTILLKSDLIDLIDDIDGSFFSINNILVSKENDVIIYYTNQGISMLHFFKLSDESHIRTIHIMLDINMISIHENTLVIIVNNEKEFDDTSIYEMDLSDGKYYLDMIYSNIS